MAMILSDDEEVVEEVVADNSKKRQKPVGSGKVKGQKDFKIHEKMKVLEVLVAKANAGEFSLTSKTQNFLVHFDFLPEGRKDQWFHSLLKWYDHAKEDEWDRMVADKDIQKQLGVDWFKKVCQTPRAWYKKLGRDKQTKGRVAYTELAGVRGDLSRGIAEKYVKLMDERRMLGEPFDDMDSMDTLQGYINDANEQLLALNEKVLPHKNSRKWMVLLDAANGIKKSAIRSQEARLPDEKACEQFEKNTNDTMVAHNIKLAFVLGHDEFREFRGRPPSYVKTTSQERDRAAKGKVQPGRFARTTTSKLGHTVGWIIAPGIGVVRGYIIFPKASISKRDLKRIKREFDEYLDVFANAKGGQNGSTHVNFFLGEVARKACNQVRSYWGKPDEVILLNEDWSPTHVGDGCKQTGETGLRDLRIEKMKASRLHRTLTPKYGNPKYGTNDQVHKLAHLKIQERIYEEIGFNRRAQKRPAPSALKPGGKYVTKSGIRRGCTGYQFAKAVHHVILNFSVGWVNAAYVRCGFATEKDMAALVDKLPEDIHDAIAGLIEAQKAVMKSKEVRLHLEHDFSGTPAESKLWCTQSHERLKTILGEYDESVVEVVDDEAEKHQAAEVAKRQAARIKCEKRPLYSVLKEAAERKARKIGDRAYAAGERLIAKKLGLAVSSIPVKSDMGHAAGSSASSAAVPKASEATQQAATSSKSSASSSSTVLPPVPTVTASAVGPADASVPKKITNKSDLTQVDVFCFAMGRVFKVKKPDEWKVAFVAEAKSLREAWIQAVLNGYEKSLGQFNYDHLEQLKALPLLERDALLQMIKERQ